MGAKNFYRLLAVTYRANPELEILGPIVVADAIDVMHGFAPTQASAELLFQDDSVLGHSPRADTNPDIASGVGPPLSIPSTFGGHRRPNAQAPMKRTEGQHGLVDRAPRSAPGHPERCCLAARTLTRGS